MENLVLLKLSDLQVVYHYENGNSHDIESGEVFCAVKMKPIPLLH